MNDVMNSKTTIIGLVAAIAVLSGGLGFSMTGVFDDQKVMTSNLPTTGFLMGQVRLRLETQTVKSLPIDNLIMR